MNDQRLVNTPDEDEDYIHAWRDFKIRSEIFEVFFSAKKLVPKCFAQVFFLSDNLSFRKKTSKFKGLTNFNLILESFFWRN